MRRLQGAAVSQLLNGLTSAIVSFWHQADLTPRYANICF